MRSFIACALLLACNVCAGDDIRDQFRALSGLRSGVAAAPSPPADGSTAYQPIDQYASPSVLKLGAPWCTNCDTEDVSDWLEASGWPVTPVNVDRDGDKQIDAEADRVFGEIESLPTFIIIRNHKVYARYAGKSRSGAVSILKTAVNADTAYTGEIARHEADASPTPHPVIIEMLKGLNLKPTDRFGELGCGDARAAIAASQLYGCKSIGYEIDPERAADAKRRVEALGLTGLVTIIEGDVTKMKVECNKGFAYLYPGTLTDLRPTIDGMERFASYLHPLPWRNGSKMGDVHFYSKVQQVEQQAEPETEYREVPYAVYGGWKYYGHCCGNMSCPMGQEILRQLAAREHVEMVPVRVQRRATTVQQAQPAQVQYARSSCSSCSSCGDD